MSNLLQRALTGILFVASIVLSIWFNNYVAIAVFSLFFIGALVEYLNLFSNHEFIQVEKYSFLIFNISFFALAVICLFFKLNFIFLFTIFPLLFLYMLLELWRKKPEPLANIATGIFGFIYLLFPFSLILILLFVSTHSFPVKHYLSPATKVLPFEIFLKLPARKNGRQESAQECRSFFCGDGECFSNLENLFCSFVSLLLW